MTRKTNVDKRVEDNLKLVHMVVRKIFHIAPKDQDYEDYVQVGCFGLIMAAEKYDPSYGIKFSTYATGAIKNQIKNYKRDYVGGPIRVERQAKTLLKKILHFDQIGYDDEAICSILSITPEQLAKGRKANLQYVYLDKTIINDNGDEAPIHEVIPDDTDTESEVIEKFTRRQALQLVRQALTDRQNVILDLLMQGKSQIAIARMVGVSQMTVSRTRNRIETVIAKAVMDYLNGNPVLLKLIIKGKEKETA